MNPTYETIAIATAARARCRSRARRGLLLLALAAATVVLAPRSVPAAAGMDWNEYGIRWQPLTLGLSMAKRENKPVVLVVYTEWCPHCATYSRVFHDPRVVEKAKDLVFVRIDADRDEAFAKRFAPDGEYIPRTFVLTPDGELVADIQAPRRDKSRYFLSTRDPGALLAVMDAALARAR